MINRKIPLLDHGYLILRDKMGSDDDICNAARISYGKGTKTVNENRGLIQYLMRHKHTSPFEMCELQWEVKAPISVMRQWQRHRTANINEESARYSVMGDDVYIPDADRMQSQNKDNKQGSGEQLSNASRAIASRCIEEAVGSCKYNYHKNINTGLSREVSRGIMPIDTYSTMIWKNDLHNTLHFLKLRMDSHAQWEIRQYANAMYEVIKALFPITIEAFDDYVKDAVMLSKHEYKAILAMLSGDNSKYDEYISHLSKREKSEFEQRFIGETE